jgi:hypothetical protein
VGWWRRSRSRLRRPDGLRLPDLTLQRGRLSGSALRDALPQRHRSACCRVVAPAATSTPLRWAPSSTPVAAAVTMLAARRVWLSADSTARRRTVNWQLRCRWCSTVVLHLSRDRTGARRLTEIGVLDRRDDGRVRVGTAWHADTGSGCGRERLTTLLRGRGPRCVPSCWRW